jgi:transposase
MVARYRGRLSPAKKKADRTDASLLARILLTDGPLHRAMPSDSHQVQALAELVRAHERALRSQRYHANQLRSHLRNYCPAALAAWAGLPQGLLRGEARALLEVAPTPRRAAGLSKRKIADTLSGAGRSRLVDAQADRLREVFSLPQLQQPAQIEEAMGQSMLTTLALLNADCKAAEQLNEQVAALFAEHPQASVYRTLPGCGPIIGARLLAEIGDAPARFATARGLRCYAGAAPLTWASGGSRAVSARRRAVNLRLKATGHMWAFATLTSSPGCRAYYDHRRAQGDTYPAALRRLYGRLLNMLHYCLLHDAPYDERRAFAAGAGPDTSEAEPPPDEAAP